MPAVGRLWPSDDDDNEDDDDVDDDEDEDETKCENMVLLPQNCLIEMCLIMRLS